MNGTIGQEANTIPIVAQFWREFCPIWCLAFQLLSESIVKPRIGGYKKVEQQHLAKINPEIYSR